MRVRERAKLCMVVLAPIAPMSHMLMWPHSFQTKYLFLRATVCVLSNISVRTRCSATKSTQDSIFPVWTISALGEAFLDGENLFVHKNRLNKDVMNSI